MDCTAAVSIRISGVRSKPVIHALVRIAPRIESSRDLVVIRLDQRSRNDGVLYQRFDGRVLNVFKQMDYDLTTALNHPEDRWLRLRYSASATFPSQAMPTPCSSLLLHGHRSACVACHTGDLVALYRSRYRDIRLFLTMPSRTSVVIWCTSL